MGDGQRAVALAVELHEAARLEARRREHDVGSREQAMDRGLGRRAHELHLVGQRVGGRRGSRDEFGVAVSRHHHGRAGEHELR